MLLTQNLLLHLKSCLFHVETSGVHMLPFVQVKNTDNFLGHDVIQDLTTSLPPEFDKFLEERAKVVDSLPSPPGGDPGPPVSAPGNSSRQSKKAERTEDALFAL